MTSLLENAPVVKSKAAEDKSRLINKNTNGCQ